MLIFLRYKDTIAYNLAQSKAGCGGFLIDVVVHQHMVNSLQICRVESVYLSDTVISNLAMERGEETRTPSIPLYLSVFPYSLTHCSCKEEFSCETLRYRAAQGVEWTYRFEDLLHVPPHETRAWRARKAPNS